MQPPIHVNWLAVVASIVASFAVGGLWFGPLFGKAWAKAMGMTAQPSGADIARALVLNLLGLFLMAFVLAHDVAVWRPSTWNVGTDDSPVVYGFFAGFFVWLGYVVPMLLNSVAFDRKSWTAFFIQVTYQFLSLQIMGMILSHWR